jgi:hypothetical protein
MIEKMPQAVVLVDRVLRALEDSQTKMDGVAFCPVTFFQHPALDGWLPQAKALMQFIDEQYIDEKPHDPDCPALDGFGCYCDK